MTRQPKTFTYDALTYSQASSKDAPYFVLFSASAEDIRQWAEVDRLSHENVTGAQRPLHPMKVSKVARYLAADPRNTIPTAVIIALDSSSATFRPTRTGAKSGPGKFQISVSSRRRRPGLIIDGQHRVHGAEKFSPTTMLNIVAMIGGDDAERAFQFVVINNTSARVSKNHITALNLQYDPEILNRRLLDSAGVSLGMKEGSYDAMQVIDLEPPFQGLLDLPTNSNGFIPPNAIESALALTKDHSALLGIEDLEVDVFQAMWVAIKKVRHSEWRKDSRLLQKVSIYAITAYLLDSLVAAQRTTTTQLDFTDAEVVKSQVARLINVIPGEFWATEWTGKGLDTSVGRQIVLAAIKLIDANVRFRRPWHKDVDLIDPARLPLKRATKTAKVARSIKSAPRKGLEKAPITKPAGRKKVGRKP